MKSLLIIVFILLMFITRCEETTISEPGRDSIIFIPFPILLINQAYANNSFLNSSQYNAEFFER